MRPLPAVLLDLHEEFATGRLALRRGKVAKTVDLVNGNPVSSASAPRDETLGAFLVNSGVITEDQHQAASTRAHGLAGKLGEALVGLQILTVEQLIEQLGKQARHKLVQALRWPQGAWRFDPADEAVQGMQLRMVEVVLGGLRETAIEDIARLARLEGMSFELTERGERLRHELRRTYGEAPVAALSAGAPMAEIEKAFGNRAQARTAIDAMLMCDAVIAKTADVGLGVPRASIPGFAPPTNPISRKREPSDPSELYDILFDDVADAHRTGDAPIQLLGAEVVPVEVEESGVVTAAEVEAVAATQKREAAANKAIAAEHQRIKAADHYSVLMLDRDANADDADGAYQIKVALLERATAKVIDSADRAKLDHILAIYEAARDVLCDPRKRTEYDRELAGGELVQTPPSFDTELTFRTAEELMAKQQWPQAIGQLTEVIDEAPGEADYHAALGWAQWKAGGERADASEEAHAHLDRALAIDPDHAAAHDYKGRIDAALLVDEAAALFHLERAIDLDPARVEAVATMEKLLVSRGELRRWERMLKRLLFKLRGSGGAAEAAAWSRLAKLYLEGLDDPTAAEAALSNARRLAPKDPEVAALAKRAERHRTHGDELIRAGWREALGDPQSGAALVRSTEAAGHADAAFLAAATMVALGTADDSMAAVYESHRPRVVALPQTPLDRDQWAMLRHKDDTPELGALLELIAPAVHALAPMRLADGDLDPSQRVEETELPSAFQWQRAQLASLIGVSDARGGVYSRVELGPQIHVVACDPPVLVAGDEALTSPERPDLVFRLARAMTFLWPGRAVGASRPGRVLRAVVLAIIREAAGTELGLDDPVAPAATEALAALTDDARTQARASAMRLVSRGSSGFNLSLWARALSRTADRAGLLLCGDVPAAFNGAKEMGDLDKDLVEFAFSAAHVRLRVQLGLSRG